MIFFHFHPRYGNSSHGIRGISNRVILNGGLTPIHDRRISKSDLKINAVSIENGKKDTITRTFSLVEDSVSYIFSFIMKNKFRFKHFNFSNSKLYFYFVSRVIPLMIQITESMKYIVQQTMLIDPITFPALKFWLILSCLCIL